MPLSGWVRSRTVPHPKAEHLKAFMSLAVEQQAFPAGREKEEIRVFWQAARQKMLRKIVQEAP